MGHEKKFVIMVLTIMKAKKKELGIPITKLFFITKKRIPISAE